MLRRSQAFKTYHLAHDEQIISWSPALRQNDVFEGIAVLTDRRFVYYRSGLLTEAIEPWPLSKINSIEARKGLLWYSLKLFTGNDVLSLTSNEKVACERVARHLQIAVGMINDGLYDDLDDGFEDDDEADAGAGDLVELLHKLDDLKKKGILTEEEFAQKKAEILARI
ncbi:SHOCT domain-containing protein [Sphingomonas sp. IC081]|uniref:SHOCT domain-containing protein n=1 Tax=Sphingomonas sp. IC081 TaxID=304378 RepID=UPI00163C83E4|nr:SHOCT domain-containing protein [Sphingomonas sp. IC081]